MSDFKHEFNDKGDWRPALVIDSHDANNVFLTYYFADDGTWHNASASRGEDVGQFRDKK